MISDPSDIALVAEILKGKRKPFEMLYSRYKRLYMSICLRYFTTWEDAEDALQDAIVKLHSKLDTYDHEKAAFITWSKRIVINTCLEKLRKPSFLKFFDNIFSFGSDLTMSPVAHDNLNLQDLTSIIQSLPKGYRTVFNLYVIDGYSHAEIAIILKITASTSKTQLMKARKLLKSKIGENDVILEHVYG